MIDELFKNIEYSNQPNRNAFRFPELLKEAIDLITKYFNSDYNSNKLCLVFPSKERTAQWLAIPLLFELIRDDYNQKIIDLNNFLNKCSIGDYLKLNNSAIVRWNGKTVSGLYSFKVKEDRNLIDEISLKIDDISLLQPAKPSETKLSSSRKCIQAINNKEMHPIDNLLMINTKGNKLLQNKRIGLLTKYNVYEDTVKQIFINNRPVLDYFSYDKVNSSPENELGGPLLIANSLANFVINYTTLNQMKYLIIDGITHIYDEPINFNDYDKFNIPTILITDLNEIEKYDFLKDYNFEFYNYTSYKIIKSTPDSNSPFYYYDTKLNNYSSFVVEKEICQDDLIDSLFNSINTIPSDDSNDNLIKIKISLFQLWNEISKIVYPLNLDRFGSLNDKLAMIKKNYDSNKYWFGNYADNVIRCLTLLEDIMKKFNNAEIEKKAALSRSILQGSYDYLICYSEDEENQINNYLSECKIINKPRIITVHNIEGENFPNRPIKAILTGWINYKTINKIIFSFNFTEIKILLYKIEERFYSALQKTNHKNAEIINTTIKEDLLTRENESIPEQMDMHLFKVDEYSSGAGELNIDISEIEFKLTQAQFNKYIAKKNEADSIKAKRIDLDNNTFIYAAESHKFLVLNELFDFSIKAPTIINVKIDKLKRNDIIAFINTDRDVLADLVRHETNKVEFEKVNYWIELWKSKLEHKYLEWNMDFHVLYNRMKLLGCKRTEVTVRNWLYNENLIGPESDSDLKIIAELTKSDELKNNIQEIRRAVSQMTSWRMKASDYLRSRIKSTLLDMNSQLIDSSIDIPDLGNVLLLRIINVQTEYQNIYKNYLHKLILKEYV